MRAHPLLMTEAPLNPDSNREKCAEVLFEHLDVPLSISRRKRRLSRCTPAEDHRISLDIGDGVAQAVPVYEGLAVRSAVVRSTRRTVDGPSARALSYYYEGRVSHAQTSAEKKLCPRSRNRAATALGDGRRR